MKIAWVSIILLVVQVKPNSIFEDILCTMKSNPKMKSSRHCDDPGVWNEMSSIDNYDSASLTDSFEKMNVSAPVSSNTCVSCDDYGYFSQSINSFDVPMCCEDVTVSDGADKTAPDDTPCADSINTDSTEFDNSKAESAYVQDTDGDTHLHIAIIQRQHMLVIWLISLVPCPNWLNIPNRLLQTPLHLAVIMRDARTVRRLMTSGARVDARDVHGNTPLHIACKEGLTDIVSCLLNPVMYTETVENKYQIPYQRIPQDLELFNYDGNNCLHLAANGTYLSVLDLLVSRGANINSRERKSGRTVLHHASETDNITLIHFLLQRRRVDVDAETYGGLTPLRLAAGRQHTRVVQLLIKTGAYDAVDSDDESDEL